MATRFEERREKIDAAAIHGNPQFGRDQLDALRAHAENDTAEALSALVGIGSELLDRLGGWQRIGVTEDGAAPVPLPEGIMQLKAALDEAGVTVDQLVALADDAAEREQGDRDDDVHEEPDLEVGDLVGIIGEADKPDRATGTVTSTGVGEGRGWAIVDGDGFPEGAKLWADQLEVVEQPVPEETERTNPEDGAEQRRLAAQAHLEHIEDEPKVEYEQVAFDKDRDNGEFDIPLGIPGKPVSAKPKGGKR